MSPTVLALVLGSAVVHATWNLWTKQLGPGVRSASLLWLLTAISSVAYAPFVWALLAHNVWRPDANALLLIAGSGVIHVGYFVLLLRGYRGGGTGGDHGGLGTLAPAEIGALWGAQAPRVLGIALLSPLSYILILLALRHGDVGHIAPAREVSILIGAWRSTHPEGGSGRALGEGDRTRRLVAAAAFAGGVVALALA